MENTITNLTDIENLLTLDYDTCVVFLLIKYGEVKGNYIVYSRFFKTISENLEIKKSWYGLEIHHIDEDKIPNLSSKENRKLYINEQKSDRLVYCNLIEHLVLHIKIYQKTKNNLSKNGIRLLIRKINDYYSYHEFEDDRNKLFFHSVKDKKLDYFKCLAYINDHKILTGKNWFACSLLEDKHNNLYQLSILYDEIDAYLKARILPKEVNDNINLPPTFKLNKLYDLDHYLKQRKRLLEQQKAFQKFNQQSQENKSNDKSPTNSSYKPSIWSKYKWEFILIFLILIMIIFIVFIITH